jgi:hypothetical protein
MLPAVFLWPACAWAGSYSLTIQPDTLTSDSYLRKDDITGTNGTKNELDLEASGDQKNRSIVVQIPLSGLADRTILQAWLRLSHTGGNAATAIDSRVYPLTEDWLEPSVAWQYRYGTTAWTRPGGTRGDYWTDRVLVSSATKGGEVSWQIGPIVQAWQLGTLPDYGVLIEADTTAPTRDAKFSSSENNTPAEHPRFVIYSTDEPPAVREGWAEIQPRAVQVGAVSVPMTLWLDVNALDSTPSGVPTGFDSLTLSHCGALAVTAITSLEVDGVPVSPDLVTWTDNGTAVSFGFPEVRIHGRVRLDFLATVLSSGAQNGVDMPVTVDDTSTPGCWAQSLWPGEADGTLGNGDNMLLVVTTAQTERILVVPDTITVVNKMCTTFAVFGEDSLGNRYPIVPDEFNLIPPSFGTIDESGYFCAKAPGTVKVIAAYGALLDTATVTIISANTPQIDEIALLDRQGTATSTIAPGDTMLVDVTLHDLDGFRDIRQLDLTVFHSLHPAPVGEPAFGATLRWQRGATPMWSLVNPLGTSWAIAPSVCEADTSTNAVIAKTIRFAFRAGGIARASLTGEWQAGVRVLSATPPDTTTGSLAGLDVQPKVTLTEFDTSAAFSAGLAGATELPLVIPSDGRLPIRIVANADYDLRGALGNLAGLTTPEDSLYVRADSQTVTWAPNDAGTGGGYLVPQSAVLLAEPAPTTEAVLDHSLYLWIRHPVVIPAQRYQGDLTLQATLPGLGATSPVCSLLVTADVVTSGLAATTALAEVTPHSVVAGTAAAVFDAYLLPEVEGTDTGVNRVEVALPASYGTPVVSSVRVGGAAVSFQDGSSAGHVVATLGTRVADGQLVRVRFTADAPTVADTTGAELAVAFDDTATAVPAQAALEGDANSVADGDNWDVEVGPGPLAVLAVVPDAAVCAVDSTVAFGAGGADAYGNTVAPVVVWSVAGGIGSISSDGLFTALHAGDGYVIATSGALADSAQVAVTAGLAATSAVAEVVPHVIQAGTSGAVFDAYLLAEVQGTDTGVNHVEIAMPVDYGVVVVSSARVAGVPVSFRDSSVAGRLVVTLGVRAGNGQLVRVRFTAGAPTLADSIGADFVVGLDDTATAAPPQEAVAGDANGVSDGDSWHVEVVAGPLAHLVVMPDPVVCEVDSVIAFAVTGSDAYGNAVSPAPSWSVIGGVGTITGEGLFRARAWGGGAVIASSGDVADTVQVTVTAGLAAHAATAEVTPHTVAAGAAATFEAYLLSRVSGTDTGVNRVQVALPAGYGLPVVTAVQVGGVTVSHRDASGADTAAAVLTTWAGDGQLVRMHFTATAPTSVDTVGANFIVSFDDTATAVPVQTATAGDANGVADGDSWNVWVGPGSLAHLVVVPGSVACVVDSLVRFGASGTDTWGNAVVPTVSWSVTGGIGTITSNGRFTARQVGAGLVVASSGAVADTAEVTVTPPPAIALRSVRGPSLVSPGQSGASMTVRVENLASDSVVVDTLALVFTRSTSGDADADFAVSGAPLPLTLPAGAVATVPLTVDVGAGAAPGPLFVDARVSAGVPARGARVRDASADTTLALLVSSSSVELAVTRPVTQARPGESGVTLVVLHLFNHYPESRTLRGIRLTNRTAGPGTPEQLDAEMGTAALYQDDGNGIADSTADVLLARRSVVGGLLDFASLAVTLPAGAATTLFVTTRVPLTARDGDVLDLAVETPGDLTLEPASSVSGDWPPDLSGGVVVDGMVADQILLEPVAGGGVSPGATDREVLRLVLPPNGYEADILERLAVTNGQGSAQAGEDIARVRAWADDGDGTFEPLQDLLLGELTFTGDRWQRTGLSVAVPSSGLRLFVTADLAAAAVEGRTLRFGLPAAPNEGAGMASGNSGPLDRPVVNPDPLTVTQPDHVTVAAVPMAPDTVQPGERGRVLLTLEVINTYASQRTLNDLSVANATTGTGTTAQLDNEIRTLVLRSDGNGNGALDSTDVDPVLATGFFEAGRATFTGLRWILPPGGTRRLFVSADVSPTGAADGDVLAAVVADAQDVGFEEPTTTVAQWPLDGGGRWRVDGFTAAQVTTWTAPGVTLSPGDGPVLALDLLVPPNGYRADVLRGVRVENLGTAAAADIAQVQLWKDGGDGAFSAGLGDDVLLGAMSALAGGWQSPMLSLAVDGAPARLFVSVTLASALAESLTVRLAVPVNGIQYESANDGPLDRALENTETILVSTSVLLATVQAPSASTIGQSVAVRMIVRNVGTETIRDVAPSALDLTGSGAVSFAGGPVPAMTDLAPAATDTFTWTGTSTAAGDVRFAGDAAGTGDPSGLPRRAPRASSGEHRVFVGADRLDLEPVMTMPVNVSRGQAGVVPMSLTFTNPGGSGASDVRVRRLKLRLEDESGTGIVPAQLLSRVVVNEGTNLYLVRTSLETTGATIDLPLATPAVVTETQPATLNLRLDILPGTTIPLFRVAITDSTQVESEDATSGAPVASHLPVGSYPIQSDVAHVVAGAADLEVQGQAPDTVHVAPGAAGVALLRARFESPGVTGISSDVRVGVFAVEFVDSNGVVVATPAAYLRELSVKSGSQIFLTRTLTGVDPAALTLTLSLPLNLPASVPLDLVVEGSVQTTAAAGGFRLRLLDSTHVDARDANTRLRVPVHYASATIAGGWIFVETPAESLLVSGQPALPPALLIGESGVNALSVALRHRGGRGVGRIRVDSLRIECRDESRQPLAPAEYLARLGLRWNGAEVATAANLPVSGGGVTLPLQAPLLQPGDSAAVEIVFDVRAAAPSGTLELLVSATGVHAVDANSGQPVTVSTPGGLPLESGLARLQAPARQLAVGLASRMPAALSADGRAVPVAVVSLRNSDPEGVGVIRLQSLVVRAAGRLLEPVPLGAAAERIEAWLDGTRWAESATLSADSATAMLVPATPLDLAPDDAASLELRLVPRADASLASLRVGCDHADVGVLQPAGALFTIAVQPEPGQAFPLWSEAGGFTVADLGGSYANFPNPFAAGREATTIVYYLRGPARVSLHILSARGEEVVTLLDGAQRQAGLHQEDRWDGRNGRGATVYNGVYVAELTARFDDGTSQQVRRKVAVVR